MSKNSSCGCHNNSSHSCDSDCGCHGAKKTEGNNQWVSPPSAKSNIRNTSKCEKAEKTQSNNQWI